MSTAYTLHISVSERTPDDANVLRKALRSVADASIAGDLNDKSPLKFRVVDADGKVVWIEASVTASPE